MEETLLIHRHFLPKAAAFAVLDQKQAISIAVLAFVQLLLAFGTMGEHGFFLR